MINFLNDPLGEMPWEEEEGTEDVRHIHTTGVSKLCEVNQTRYTSVHELKLVSPLDVSHNNL